MPWQHGNPKKQRSHQSSNRWWTQAQESTWRRLPYHHSSRRAPSSCPQSRWSRCTLRPNTVRSWHRPLSCTRTCWWGATQPSSAPSRRPPVRWTLTVRTRPSLSRGVYLTLEAPGPWKEGRSRWRAPTTIRHPRSSIWSRSTSFRIPSERDLIQDSTWAPGCEWFSIYPSIFKAFDDWETCQIIDFLT